MGEAANAVAEAFSNVGEQIDALSERIENRFISLDARLSLIEARMAEHAHILSNDKPLVSALKDHVRDLRGALDAVSEVVSVIKENHGNGRR